MKYILLISLLVSCGSSGSSGLNSSSSTTIEAQWDLSSFPLSFSFSSDFTQFGDLTPVKDISLLWADKVSEIDTLLNFSNDLFDPINSTSKNDYYSQGSSIPIHYVASTYWQAMNLSSQALAVTIYTISGSTNFIYQAAILINADHLFFITLEALKYDLKTTISHEIGHVLGLNHIGNADDENNLNIMKAKLEPGEERLIPQSEELEALNSKYTGIQNLNLKSNNFNKPDYHGVIEFFPNSPCLHH